MSATAYFDDDLPAFLTSRDRKRNSSKKKAAYRTSKQQPSTTFDINVIRPLTENQIKTFNAFNEGQNLLLHGVAGTGKTFLSLYLSLHSVITGKSPKPVVILRSVVPGRDMGFLPGKIEEKSMVYETPYVAICSELTGHPTSYDHMKEKGLIEFSTTSYLRGLTFRNNTIIVDEAQNCSGSELNTIMTRVGEGCRVIICADFTQTDLQRSEEKMGFKKLMSIINHMSCFTHVEFDKSDIVRSGFVKEYIIAKTDLNIEF